MAPSQKEINYILGWVDWVDWLKSESEIVLRADLHFKSHMDKITKVRPFLTQQEGEGLTHAFISSRLVYCNALVTSQQKKTSEELHIIKNAAARI